MTPAEAARHKYRCPSCEHPLEEVRGTYHCPKCGHGMDAFKQTDFVQIEHYVKHESGEIAQTWRNALYIGKDKNGRHMVIYTDGTKCVLAHNMRIRKAKP